MVILIASRTNYKTLQITGMQLANGVNPICLFIVLKVGVGDFTAIC